MKNFLLNTTLLGISGILFLFALPKADNLPRRASTVGGPGLPRWATPVPPRLEYSVLRTGPFDVAKVFGRVKGCEDASPELIGQVAQAAFQANQDPKIIAATVAVESSCNSLAVSNRGALGLMQVMPKTWKSQFDFSRENLLNPRDNLRVGTKILTDLINQYGVRDGVRRYQGLGVDCESCDGHYVEKILKTAGVK